MSIRNRLLLTVLAAAVLPVCPGAAAAAPASPFGKLGGQALARGGDGLGEVEVLVVRAADIAGALFTRTDGRGHFLFPRLPQAEYLVVATRVGYLAAVARVASLPADRLQMVLVPEGTEPDNDMTWVLRLPARDLLRQLEQGLPLPTSGPAPAADAGARLEQRFGVGVSESAEGSTAVDSSPDLATRFDYNGQAQHGVAWRSGAEFRDTRLSAETGSRRKTEDLGLAGGADVPLAGAGRVETDLAVRRQRLTLGSTEDFQENRMARLDARAQFGDDGLTRASLHLRGQEAEYSPDAPGTSQSAVGLSVQRDFDLAPAHRLQTSLAVRRFSSLADDALLVSHGSESTADPFQLRPEGSWYVVSLRDRFTPAPGVVLSYGTDVEYQDGDNGSGGRAVPALGIDWSPTARTSLNAGLRYRAEVSGSAPAALCSGPSTSVRLGLSQALSGHTRLALEAHQEDVSGHDPFASSSRPGSSLMPWIWTDGAAESREVRLALDQELGPLVARVQYSYGELEGRLSTPDPFAFSIAHLAAGTARYHGGVAAAFLRRWGTEISLTYGRLESGDESSYRVLGFNLRQGVPMPFATPATWRLLLDYEQIDGGHPFTEAGPPESEGAPTRVGRVSGGVAVQF